MNFFRNTIGHACDNCLVDFDALQEDIGLQKFIVVVQQHWCMVHWGKTNSRDAYTANESGISSSWEYQCPDF